MPKSVVILGGGESGIWAARLAQINGDHPFVSDNGRISTTNKSFLDQYAILYEEEGHTLSKLLMADIIVKSPGIPQDIPVIIKLRKAGMPIISEIEYAGRYSSSNIIGITGSNGKTTTSRLIHHILRENGVDVGLAGNIGLSFSEYLCRFENEWVVLELSSFQLEDVRQFKPKISVFLNLTADHMDRYDHNMDIYFRAKWNITSKQDESDIFIYNCDDARLCNAVLARNISPVLKPIGLREWSFSEFYDNNDNHWEYHQLPLSGRHNAYNMMAALAVAESLGLERSRSIVAMQNFVNDPHRLELVKNEGGVRWVNDSKATNVDAVYFAIEAMDGPVIWIVGGIDKGNDYNTLLPVMKSKVKTIVAMGSSNDRILDFFRPLGYEVRDTRSMSEAVAVCKALAINGDIVLLSPACASFDLFKNYEDRGEQFKIFALK